MARVLAIEDDKHIAQLLKLYLEHEGHEVIQAFDGREGVRLAGLEDPDLIVLDLMLPGMHGRDVCSAIRRRSSVPILMLTALDDDRDIVEGLDVGADDYITKPFKPAVLLARVRAALRRAEGPAGIISEIPLGRLVIIPEQRRVHLDGRDIDLRPREFDLLLTLARRPEVVFRREKLLELIWDDELDVDTRTIDVHVNRLRSKLAGTGVEVETVRGVGYRMAADRHEKGEG